MCSSAVTSPSVVQSLLVRGQFRGLFLHLQLVEMTRPRTGLLCQSADTHGLLNNYTKREREGEGKNDG